MISMLVVLDPRMRFIRIVWEDKKVQDIGDCDHVGVDSGEDKSSWSLMSLDASSAMMW